MQEASKTRLTLICFAVGVTLLPLSVTTGFLAYRALTETSRYLNAPLLESDNQKQGRFYHVSGTFNGALLNPPDFPEVKDALWYRVVSERRPSQDQPWHRDTSAALVAERVQHFKIDQNPIEVGMLSKVTLPITLVHRTIDPFHRLSIEYKPLPFEQQPLTAIGFLNRGHLTDGVFERLMILDKRDQETVFNQVTRKGYHKGFFLGGISGIFWGLLLAMFPLSKKFNQADKKSLKKTHQ